MLLQDRVALITGAGSGLGLATAQAFAAEGAKVVVNDINEETAQEAARGLGAGHLALGGDVGKEAEVAALVEKTMAAYGRIDILVNNAGMGDSFVPTVDQPLSHWQRLIDVHLTGTYLLSKTVAPHMIAAGSGAILNISSIAGIVGLPVRTAYSTAKAGIAMLTKVLGSEWAPHGVRVNAVAPGYILTPLVQKMVDAKKIDTDAIRRRTPKGQLGRPQDIADALVFLASDKARFIVGVTLPVDGGYSAWGAPSDAYPFPLED